MLNDFENNMYREAIMALEGLPVTGWGAPFDQPRFTEVQGPAPLTVQDPGGLPLGLWVEKVASNIWLVTFDNDVRVLARVRHCMTHHLQCISWKVDIFIRQIPFNELIEEMGTE